MLQDRVFQLWLENQKFKSHEIGFATLSKGEEMQVKEIMKELVIVNSSLHLAHIDCNIHQYDLINNQCSPIFLYILD